MKRYRSAAYMWRNRKRCRRMSGIFVARIIDKSAAKRANRLDVCACNGWLGQYGEACRRGLLVVRAWLVPANSANLAFICLKRAGW